MYPSRNMDNYMSEIHRLFPRPNESDLYSTQYPSPLSGSGANRSSSSADSTSPDSFPELLFSPERNGRPSGGDIVETPRNRSQLPFVDPNFTSRRQRPIVGRKILPPTETPPAYEKPFISEREANIWQSEDYQSSSPISSYYIENKYTQNVFYELFPSENRGFEFPQFLTPLKQTPPSPSFASPAINSPMKTSPPYNVSPNYSYMASQPRYGSPNQSAHQSANTQVTRFQTPDLRQKMCTFCRKNGETPVVYMTHSVKERAGNKYVVTCPILRSHVCSTCGGTGDDAHTITYCPVLRSTNNGQPLQSTTITLKNTRIKSNVVYVRLDEGQPAWRENIVSRANSISTKIIAV